MALIIHKKDSEKEIREKIKKAVADQKKKSINLDRYFGKINFGSEGLKYQKRIRNEWQ